MTFCSQDIQIIVFLMNPQTSKSVAPLHKLDIRSYKFHFIFRILGSIKMEISWVLVQLTINISYLFLLLL